jgi:FMN-dependent NADH-azoreductase
MYNFSIPAVLKSYIDYIVRPRRTFTATENGFKGLVTNKKMILVQARGSDFRPGSVYDTVNFQEPYLKTVFGFIGRCERTIFPKKNCLTLNKPPGSGSLPVRTLCC